MFLTERGGPMTPKGFNTLIHRIGERAGMPFPVHPHMLRHACGYALANAGHDTRALQAWLGHKNIQHTVDPALRDRTRPSSGISEFGRYCCKSILTIPARNIDSKSSANRQH